MFGLLRLQLAMVPLLWSLWRQDSSAGSGGAAGAEGGSGASHGAEGAAGGAGGSGSGSGADGGAQGNTGAQGAAAGAAGARHTDDDVNRIVRERLAAEETRMRDRIRAEVDAETERARLQAEGNLQGLLDNANTELGQLRPLRSELEQTAAARDAALAAVRAQVEAQMADLPPYITAAIAPLDPVAQLQYLAEHMAAIREAQGSGTGGIPRTRQNNGGGDGGANVVSDYIQRSYGNRQPVTPGANGN